MYSLRVEFKGVEATGSDRFPYEITCYFEHCFDFQFPMRDVLQAIFDRLRPHAEVMVSIGDYFEYEDFIEFEFCWGVIRFFGYFEHSLCYIAFFSTSADQLSELRSCIGSFDLVVKPCLIEPL